jgi:hypothetical protein
MSQEDTKHLSRSITSNEIEAAIKSFQTKKNPELDEFTAEFYQSFKEELTEILLKCLHKIETEGTLTNSLYEATITLTPKLDNGMMKRKIIGQFP